MTIVQKLIHLVAWIVDVPTAQICATTNFREDLNLDKIDFDIMILKLESFFNIVLSQSEILKIETVNDACVAFKPYA